MTRDKLEKILKENFSPYVYKIYVMSDLVVLTNDDTLSDNFQVASAIVSIFERYAEGKLTCE